MYKKDNYLEENAELKLKYNESKNFFFQNQFRNNILKTRYGKKIQNEEKKNSVNSNNFIHLNSIKNQYLKSKILSFLEKNPNFQAIKINLKNLKSSDILKNHESIINLRKLIASQKIDYQILYDSDSFFKFFEFANNENQPHLQFESIICLSFLCNSNFLIVDKMMNKGIFEIFLRNCDNYFLSIRKEALLGLLNISRLGFVKSKFFDSKYLDFLEKKYISCQDQEIRDIFLFIFSNLCKKYEFEEFNNKMRPFFITIVENFIISSNIELMKKIIESISISLFKILIQYLTNFQFLNKLKRFYLTLTKDYNKNSQNIINLLKILLIITKTLKVSNIQFLIDLDFLNFFTIALEKFKSEEKQLICLIISNMLLGSEEQILKIICQKDLFTKIIFLLYSKNNKIAFKALEVISNFCKSKNRDVISFVINDLKILSIFKTILQNEPEKENLLTIFEALIELFYFFKRKDSFEGFKEKVIEDGVACELKKYQSYEDIEVYARCLFIFDFFLNLNE